MGEIYTKCCGDIFRDAMEINTEVCGKNDSKTIDMGGYQNKIELEYDEFICTYSEDNDGILNILKNMEKGGTLEISNNELLCTYSEENGGTLKIAINAKANDNKWSKVYLSEDYNESLKEMGQIISKAREDDTIKAYMYEDNPSSHSSLELASVMQDYPLLINVDDKFSFILPREGDLTTYIINGDKNTLKLIKEDN